MSGLKPIGSEKLTGQDKINRIMEIARFNETIPQVVNETAKSEYSISLADGNNYQIVKERQGYIIKRTISESDTDYIEPMKNRKYYSSYSQAFKRLNLLAGELNRVNENQEGISLYGEQKKFTLKTPKPAAPAAPEVPATPPPVPSPELPASPMDDMGIEGEEMPMDDMGAEAPEVDNVDVDIDVDAEEGGDEGQVTFKSIQKLTGKLTQKIRTLESQEGMTSEDIKYVINMVLSSFDLNSLSEEDKEDIMSKFEEESEDLGGDDMDGEDMTDDTEVEDIQADMDVAVEGEMGEDFDDEEWLFSKRSDDDDFEDTFEKEWLDNINSQIGDEDYEFELNRKNRKNNDYPINIKPRKSGSDEIFDSIFGESKVDKVISKYFEVTKKEIRESKEKKVQKTLDKKNKVKQMMESVVKMTTSVEQELSAEKFLKENTDSNFVGITNKKNLVFDTKQGQVKIAPNGEII